MTPRWTMITKNLCDISAFVSTSPYVTIQSPSNLEIPSLQSVCALSFAVCVIIQLVLDQCVSMPAIVWSAFLIYARWHWTLPAAASRLLSLISSGFLPCRDKTGCLTRMLFVNVLARQLIRALRRKLRKDVPILKWLQLRLESMLSRKCVRMESDGTYWNDYEIGFGSSFVKFLMYRLFQVKFTHNIRA